MPSNGSSSSVQADRSAPTAEPELGSSGHHNRLHPEWMSRDVRLLMLARVFMSSTRALAGVLVPIYLALIGFSAVRLGALFVVVSLTSAGLSAMVGLLSDRIGRKPFLVVLPLFVTLAGIAFALTRSTVLLFIFAALGSFGRGAGAGSGTVGPYQPAEQALLADAVPARARNSMFGVVAFSSSLGALIGGGPLAAIPALAPHLSAHLQDTNAYRPAFLVMALFALIAGLLAVPVRSPRPVAPAPPMSNSPTRRWSRLRPRMSPPSWTILRLLWITNSCNGLAVGFFGPFITYWFYRRYGVGPGTIGLLYTVINSTTMMSNLGASRFAARFGLVRAITVARLLQASLLIPMVLAPTFWLAGGVYLVRMLAQRLALPLRQSYVMAVIPAQERGTVGALASLPSQATSAVSPGVAGYLFANGSLALPFEVGSLLQGLNAVLFYLFFRDIRPPEEREAGPVRGPTPNLNEAENDPVISVQSPPA